MKRVHYSEEASEHQGEIDKEAIEVPKPAPRRISQPERILAAVMSPNNREFAQMHGLVGKPLLCVARDRVKRADHFLAVAANGYR